MSDHAASNHRSACRLRTLVGTVAVAASALALAACGGGSGGGTAGGSSSTDAKVIGADATASNVLAKYESTVAGCKSKITCIEAADRTAGNAIHQYANTMGSISAGKNNTKAAGKALESAQNLANSFEILGDADPTQANYDKVLGDFDLQKAINTLKSDISAVNGAYSN